MLRCEKGILGAATQAVYMLHMVGKEEGASRVTRQFCCSNEPAFRRQAPTRRTTWATDIGISFTAHG